MKVPDVNSAEEKITRLMKDIGLKINLNELEINAKDIGLITKNINLERMKNNPRTISKRALKEILKNLL